MTTYTLVVMFDKQDLKCIHQAGEKVILIKEPPDGKNRVVWVTFTPFERNLVTWNNDYFLYASPTPLRESTPIVVVATQKAQAQNNYRLNSDRTFCDPQPDKIVKPNQYMITNDLPFEQSPSLIFGMAQAYNLNSKATKPQPINATVVPAKQFARFTPKEKVLIFLATNIAQSSIHNGVKLEVNSGSRNFGSEEFRSSDGVESVATELNFSSSKTISVKYLPSQGKFLQQSLTF